MDNINKLLIGQNNADVRGALYYLGRYIKQAAIFHNYKKDIFEDSIESIPTELVKKLTLDLIAAVEEIAGKKASGFDNNEFRYWMSTIADLGNKIEPEPTEADIQKALNRISQFKDPNSHI